MTDITQVHSDPRWLPDQLAADEDRISFIRLSDDAIRAAPFMDQRVRPSASDQLAVPLSQLLSQNTISREAPRARYIFHSAFCCSTLMATALDVPGQTLSLKEPNILMDLANAKRVSQRFKSDPAFARSVTDLILNLLARPHGKDETIIIKPTNAANNLLPDVLERGHKVLLMYSDLKAFLVSVIKKGEACRSFIRGQYNIFGLDGGALASIPARQAMTFPDLQVAALVWRHQLEGFSENAGHDLVRTLTADEFLNDKAGSLSTLAAHFELEGLAIQAEEIANGPVFTKDSKFDRAFDDQVRAQSAADIAEQHKDAINVWLTWAENLSLGQKLNLPLPQALD